MRENPLLSWLYLHLFFATGNTRRRAPSAHAIPMRTIRVSNKDEEKEPNAQAGSHPSWHSEELPRQERPRRLVPYRRRRRPVRHRRSQGFRQNEHPQGDPGPFAHPKRQGDLRTSIRRGPSQWPRRLRIGAFRTLHPRHRRGTLPAEIPLLPETGSMGEGADGFRDCGFRKTAQTLSRPDRRRKASFRHRAGAHEGTEDPAFGPTLRWSFGR